jgi:hypothetical protein
MDAPHVLFVSGSPIIEIDIGNICRRSLAGIFVKRSRLAQLFFTSEHTLFSSGMNASSAGIVAISL